MVFVILSCFWLFRYVFEWWCVSFDLCVVYGVGVCIDVCGVVFVVECVCFLRLGVVCYVV